jgi:hypothetical protein
MLKPKGSQGSGYTYTLSPNKQKRFKQTLSACRKLMATVFWGRKAEGGIHATATAITLQVYCDTFKTWEGRAVQKKSLGMLTNGVMLLPDNERPHTAAHSSTTRAFQLAVIRPSSLPPQSRSRRLLPAYFPEQLVAITVL